MCTRRLQAEAHPGPSGLRLRSPDARHSVGGRAGGHRLPAATGGPALVRLLGGFSQDARLPSAKRLSRAPLPGLHFKCVKCGSPGSDPGPSPPESLVFTVTVAHPVAPPQNVATASASPLGPAGCGGAARGPRGGGVLGQHPPRPTPTPVPGLRASGAAGGGGSRGPRSPGTGPAVGLHCAPGAGRGGHGPGRAGEEPLLQRTAAATWPRPTWWVLWPQIPEEHDTESQVRKEREWRFLRNSRVRKQAQQLIQRGERAGGPPHTAPHPAGSGRSGRSRPPPPRGLGPRGRIHSHADSELRPRPRLPAQASPGWTTRSS